MRFSTQCENARKLSDYLALHKEKVLKVHYPGLTTHTTYEEASELFGKNGFGAIVTFDLKGGRKACDIFVEKVSGHISYIPTLGDAESILLHVPTVFGDKKYPYSGMIRLSVGFEPYEELEQVIRQALAGC